MAPAFSPAPRVVSVTQGGMAPIEQAMLTVSDPDTPLSELKVTLVTAPARGTVMKDEGQVRAVLQQGLSSFVRDRSVRSSEGTS
jgi:hypothetical protein